MDGCQETRTVLGGAADAQLEGELRTRVEAHLSGCAECQAALTAQHEVRQWLSARPSAPVPAGFVQRVQRRIGDAEGGMGEGWMGLADWRRWTQLALPVAAGLFAAVLLTGNPSTPAATSASDSTTVLVPSIESLAPETDSTAAAWWRSDVSGDDLLARMLGAESVTKGTANGR